MRLGLICSAHGFGHVGRQLATIERLLALGHDVVLFTAAPPELVAMPRLRVIPWRVDVGIAQLDSLTEDLERTRVLWAEAVDRVDALAAELAGLDAVLVDVAATGLEAARRAGVPALAVGNFDWAWIYEQYPELRDLAPQMRAWQAPHPGVSLGPGPGLTGFSKTTRVDSPLARRAAPVRVVEEGAAVLVAFGGLGLRGLDAWLPQIPGVTWILTPPQSFIDRDDIQFVSDVPFPSLLAGADAVLTKPGYGVLSEAMLAGARLCWVDRGKFPEAPFLEAAMRARGDVKVVADVQGAVRLALAAGRCAPVATAAVDPVVNALLARASSTAGP